MTKSEIIAEIERLKKEKGAVILAHYYTSQDVQEVADFLGDSLALSVKAKDIEAPIILFAGVNFMAETAKVLSPDKKVLIPVPEAGCSLAESCQAKALARMKSEHPDHLVVSYVNTSVEVKALTDICCTSTNALKVVESIPREKPIIFAPDRNLGSYIKRLTKRENMLIWDGACVVHEEFSLKKMLELKSKYPKAEIVAHPECKAEIIECADYVGSTAGILEYCGRVETNEFIVVTEPGILAQMQKKYPQKRFIPAPGVNSGEGENQCHYMKMVTLENILECLKNESPQVELDEQTRKSAEKSILNMVSIA